MSSASYEIGGEKKWRILDDLSPQGIAGKEALTQALGINPVVSRLLWNRGYRTPEDAKAYFSLANEMLGDPFVLTDMDRATERIVRAISSHERITVYGDYDVDGVTSVTALLLYLRSKGGDVGYFIPNRFDDGYGVSDAAVSQLAADGTKLIVTVDTGITANSEVQTAKSLGVDFIVTDHHECCGDLPDAYAVVNPHRPDCPYPFKELAGVGVVFKLLCALEEKLSGVDRITAVNTVALEYADLIAVGTIADVMPIIGENRLIVKLGLETISRRPRPSLAALIDMVGAKGDQRDALKKKKQQKITSSFIGFTVAPRINAVGRVRSASLAVEFLLSEDPGRATELAEVLCDANRERQEEENRIVRDAFAMIEAEHDFAKDPVIVLSSDEWHHGVIGIVASRITEHYGLPSILVSFEGGDDPYPSPDDIGKGSGRSVKGLNLFDALSSCENLLAKYGGHELAAGLSIRRDDFPAFRERINDYARERLTHDALIPTLDADCEVSFDELTLDLAKEIEGMEPFGVGNPTPTFVSRDLIVREIIPISGGKHTKLLVGAGDLSFEAMCFRMTESALDLYVGEKVDLLYTVGINEYAGRRSLQMIVKDRQTPVGAADRFDRERDALSRILSGEEPDGVTVPVPERNDFAAVYRLIREYVAMGERYFPMRGMLSRLSRDPSVPFGYLKLGLILHIFAELNIVTLTEEGKDLYLVGLCNSQRKVDLEKSEILARVKRFTSV
ncbi:MAG: single-stranded-DNA-specific exonuclease RecJ [Clostridia bacterium]|nr:single-stranded-DNA-specific exonuclease RecJ [Clostridia bacterium]